MPAQELSALGVLLIALGVVAGLVGLAVAAFALNAYRLARQMGGPASTCADAARPGWIGTLSARVTGPGVVSPLSGDRVAWWRVTVQEGEGSRRRIVAKQESSARIVVADATGSAEVEAAAINPYPEWVRRWASAENPLADAAARELRELGHGEVPAKRYVAGEFSLQRGQYVVVRGAHQPDGTIGPFRSRGSVFFAPAPRQQVAGSARRGSSSMARLAGFLFAVSALLIAAGIVLR